MVQAGKDGKRNPSSLATPRSPGIDRRAAILALLSIPLASWTPLSAQRPAWLTISLDQWAGITVTHRNHTVHLRAEDIFAALQET